jgi:hypothetical protein
LTQVCFHGQLLRGGAWSIGGVVLQIEGRCVMRKRSQLQAQEVVSKIKRGVIRKGC